MVFVFQQKPLEKVCFIYKMTGLAMVRPASSDSWKAPLERIVVYHSHRQTSRSTVSANGKQNFRLVNFVPGSRFPYVQIKDSFEEEMNTNFRLKYSIRKNRTTFSEIPLLPEIFP